MSAPLKPVGGSGILNHILVSPRASSKDNTPSTVPSSSEMPVKQKSQVVQLKDELFQQADAIHPGLLKFHEENKKLILTLEQPLKMSEAFQTLLKNLAEIPSISVKLSNTFFESEGDTFSFVSKILCSNIIEIAYTDAGADLEKLKEFIKACEHNSSLILEGNLSNKQLISLICIADLKSKLTKLELRKCEHISDQDLDILATFKLNLSSLKLVDCTSCTEDGIRRFIIGQKFLQTLDLSGCKVTDQLLLALPELLNLNAKFETLSEISLQSTQITEKGLDEIFKKFGRFLKKVNIHGCKVDGEKVIHLITTLFPDNHSSLVVLNLGKISTLTDRHCDILAGKLATLQYLDVSFTSVTLKGVLVLLKRPGLKKVHFSLSEKGKTLKSLNKSELSTLITTDSFHEGMSKDHMERVGKLLFKHHHLNPGDVTAIYRWAKLHALTKTIKLCEENNPGTLKEPLQRSKSERSLNTRERLKALSRANTEARLKGKNEISQNTPNSEPTTLENTFKKGKKDRYTLSLLFKITEFSQIENWLKDLSSESHLTLIINNEMLEALKKHSPLLDLLKKYAQNALDKLIFDSASPYPTGKALKHFKYLVNTTHFPKCKRLDLSGCTLLSADLMHKMISLYPEIKDLNLSNCTQVDDRYIDNLKTKSLQTLETLSLQNCPITSSGLEKFLRERYTDKPFILLKKLNLSGTNVPPGTFERIFKGMPLKNLILKDYPTLNETDCCTIRYLFSELTSIDVRQAEPKSAPFGWDGVKGLVGRQKGIKKIISNPLLNSSTAIFNDLNDITLLKMMDVDLYISGMTDEHAEALVKAYINKSTSYIAKLKCVPFCLKHALIQAFDVCLRSLDVSWPCVLSADSMTEIKLTLSDTKGNSSKMDEVYACLELLEKYGFNGNLKIVRVKKILISPGEPDEEFITQFRMDSIEQTKAHIQTSLSEPPPPKEEFIPEPVRKPSLRDLEASELLKMFFRADDSSKEEVADEIACRSPVSLDQLAELMKHSISLERDLLFQKCCEWLKLYCGPWCGYDPARNEIQLTFTSASVQTEAAKAVIMTLAEGKNAKIKVTEEGPLEEHRMKEIENFQLNLLVKEVSLIDWNGKLQKRFSQPNKIETIALQSTKKTAVLEQQDIEAIYKNCPLQQFSAKRYRLQDPVCLRLSLRFPTLDLLDLRYIPGMTDKGYAHLQKIKARVHHVDPPHLDKLETTELMRLLNENAEDRDLKLKLAAIITQRADIRMADLTKLLELSHDVGSEPLFQKCGEWIKAFFGGWIHYNPKTNVISITLSDPTLSSWEIDEQRKHAQETIKCLKSIKNSPIHLIEQGKFEENAQEQSKVDEFLSSFSVLEEVSMVTWKAQHLQRRLSKIKDIKKILLAHSPEIDDQTLHMVRSLNPESRIDVKKCKKITYMCIVLNNLTYDEANKYGDLSLLNVARFLGMLDLIRKDHKDELFEHLFSVFPITPQNFSTIFDHARANHFSILFTHCIKKFNQMFSKWVMFEEPNRLILLPDEGSSKYGINDLIPCLETLKDSLADFQVSVGSQAFQAAELEEIFTVISSKIKILSLNYPAAISNPRLFPRLIQKCSQLTNLSMNRMGVTEHSRSQEKGILQLVEAADGAQFISFESFHTLSIQEITRIIKKHRSTLQYLNLAHLSIEDTDLSKILDGCTNLETLDLTGCYKLNEYAFLAVASTCPKLTTLHLGGCANSILNGRPNFYHLKELSVPPTIDVKKELLKETMPLLTQFNFLNKRYIHKLYEEDLAELHVHCPDIDSLSLENCVDILPEVLANIVHRQREKLKSLKLASNFHLTDRDLEKILQETKLWELDVSKCDLLTDEALTIIAQCCPHLKKLNVSGCSKISLKIAASFPRLEHANLSSCKNITEEGLLIFAPLVKNLRHLNLGYGGHSKEPVIIPEKPFSIGDSFKELFQGEKEEFPEKVSPILKFNITKNGILAFCKHCEKLRELMIPDNMLSDRDIFEIASSVPFEVLDLRFSHKITEDAISRLFFLCPLRSLLLEGCKSIPKSLTPIIASWPANKKQRHVEVSNLSKASLLMLRYFLPELTSLHLSHSDLSLEDIQILCEYWPSLTSLTFVGKPLRNGAEVKVVVDHLKSLEVLHLIGNMDALTDETLITIANGAPFIRKLSVVSQRITDEGVNALAAHCHKLTELNLKCENVTTDALVNIVKCCPELVKVPVNNPGQLLATLEALDIEINPDLHAFLSTSAKLMGP